MAPAPNIEAIVQRISQDQEAQKTAAYWLAMLSTLPRHEIGVIKAGGRLLGDEWLPQLAMELACLASPRLSRIESEIGFYLPLVIGGGVDYDRLPAYAASGKVNGLRVTTTELIGQMLPVAWRNQARVAAALRGAGVGAVEIPIETIHVKPHGPEYDRAQNHEVDVGYVGDVVNVDTKPIIVAIDRQQIPVFSHLGFCPADGKLYNINADTLAAQIARATGARKLIMISDTAVQDGQHRKVRALNSRAVLDKMIADGEITGGMVTKLQEAFALLETLGPDHSVQITTLKYKNGAEGQGSLESTGLLEELFTDGDGTILRLPSPVIAYPLPTSALREEQLREMINQAFNEQQGRVLVPGYFAGLVDKNPTLYLDEAKRGVAVTYPLPAFSGCEYMCKLATRPDFKGLGIATSIVGMIILQKGAVAWRSSRPSKVYDAIIDQHGGFKEERGPYTVYGVGIPDDKKEDVILRVVSIPSTLQKAEGTP